MSNDHCPTRGEGSIYFCSIEKYFPNTQTVSVLCECVSVGPGKFRFLLIAENKDGHDKNAVYCFMSNLVL